MVGTRDKMMNETHSCPCPHEACSLVSNTGISRVIRNKCSERRLVVQCEYVRESGEAIGPGTPNNHDICYSSFTYQSGLNSIPLKIHRRLELQNVAVFGMGSSEI